MDVTVAVKGRRILVVDDEMAIRKALQVRLREEGAETDTAADVKSALERIQTGSYDLVVLDHRLPDGTGLALLEQVRSAGNPVEFVMMTAYSSTDDAVRAMKAGAADYVMKPFDLDEMVLVVARALENRALRGEVRRFRAREQSTGSVDNLIGDSAMMRELRDLVRRVAATGARTILIRGESGTGKDMVARALHYSSPEADRPFLNITCTALPETLLETELFGHEKGAFTDGKQAKAGLFEQADGGTIFLDEIGDMPQSLQAKLLRFLESKQFRRVGGLRDLSVDVRIVAATNCNLEEAIEKQRFRSDLYYRLNVIPIDIAPLREHREDVPALVEHFVRKFAAELRKPIRGFDAAAMELLESYDWPGNVRELKNCVERAAILAGSPDLGVADLPRNVQRGAAAGAARTVAPVAWSEPAARSVPPAQAVPAVPAQAATTAPATSDGASRDFLLPAKGCVVDEVLKDLLDQALARCNGNKSRAAALLGIHRDQVRYWVKKYGLSRWIGTREPSGAGDELDT